MGGGLVEGWGWGSGAAGTHIFRDCIRIDDKEVFISDLHGRTGEDRVECVAPRGAAKKISELFETFVSTGDDKDGYFFAFSPLFLDMVNGHLDMSSREAPYSTDAPRPVVTTREEGGHLGITKDPTI